MGVPGFWQLVIPFSPSVRRVKSIFALSRIAEFRFICSQFPEGSVGFLRPNSPLFGFTRPPVCPLVGLDASPILSGWAGLAGVSSFDVKAGQLWLFIAAPPSRERQL